MKTIHPFDRNAELNMATPPDYANAVEIRIFLLSTNAELKRRSFGYHLSLPIL